VHEKEGAMKFSRFVSAVLATVVVGCGAAGSSDAVATTTTEPATSTTSITSPTEAAQVPEPEDPTDYLVAMANGAADLAEVLRSHDDEVNEKYAAASTEDEQLAYMEALYGGLFSLQIQHAHWMSGLTPPAAFADAHEQYVDAYLGYYEPILERTEQLETIADWDEWWPTLFDTSETYVALAESCQDIVDVAAAEGYRVDLMCPTPPPEVIEVEVELGGAWVARPDVIPLGNVVVEMTITNLGDAPVRVVVLDVFDGDPLDLPIENGLVDLSVSGVTFDSAAPHAYFAVAYPDVFIGEDSKLGEPPPDIQPGETVFATVHGSGPIVVFDYTAGQFEAGAHVVIQRREERK
jgi:hypothetical protein